jgi:hypothetical protein
VAVGCDGAQPSFASSAPALGRPLIVTFSLQATKGLENRTRGRRDPPRPACGERAGVSRGATIRRVSIRRPAPRPDLLPQAAYGIQTMWSSVETMRLPEQTPYPARRRRSSERLSFGGLWRVRIRGRAVRRIVSTEAKCGGKSPAPHPGPFPASGARGIADGFSLAVLAPSGGHCLLRSLSCQGTLGRKTWRRSMR